MKISEDEWKKYRDIAPETIDDDRLKKLISNNEADPVLIAAAIENLWQDQPQVGSSAWTSTSKPKKEVGRGSSHGKNAKSSGGREKFNRHMTSSSTDVNVRREAATAAPQTKTSSFFEKENTRVLRPVNMNSLSVIASSNHPAWKDSTNFAQKLKEQLTAQPVVVPIIEQQISITPEVSVDIQGDEVLEEQVIQSTPGNDVEILVDTNDIDDFEGETEDFEHSDFDINKSNTSAVESFIAEVEVDIDIPEEDGNDTPDDNILDLQSYANLSGDISSQSVEFSEQPIDISSPPQYLNLGKWEKQSDSIEIGGFQFGSFGSEETPQRSTITTGTVWSDVQPIEQTNGIHSTMNNNQPWGSNISHVAELTHPSSVISPSDLSSLFPIQTQKAAVSDNVAQIHSSSRFDQNKHILPPGLETHSQLKSLNMSSQQMSKVPLNVNQPRKQDVTQQQVQYPNQNQFQQYQQQQQLQQAGSSLLSSNRGPNVSAGQTQSPPFYNSTFDLPSGAAAQYSQHPYTATTAPTAPNLLPTVANVPSTLSSPPTVQPSTAASIPQQSQQQQQQTFAPPPGITNTYGYYPYGYPNQPYYYSQPNVSPNYYGQNRNVYQNPRSSYQADPYSNNGSMYPNDVYPSGQQHQQFSDSSNSYGSMQVPQHPSLSQQQQTAASLSSVNSAALSMANKQKTGTLPVANQQQHTTQQDIASQHSSYAYNPYPPVRGNDASWSYQQQQNNNQGWGGQMVSFPQSQGSSNTNAPTQNSSFSPPLQQSSQTASQSQNPRDLNQRPNPSPAVGYNSNVGGGGSFNPRGSAPAW